MAEDINERLAREWTSGLIDTERAPDGTTIPVPVEDLASLVRTVKALKSAVDQLTGRTGSVYDKPLTLRDLVDGGLSALRIGSDVIGSGSLGSGTTAPGTIVPANPDGPGYQDPRPVLAVPPVLTNVTANGAFRNVIVVWKRTEYRNHAYVEVWRAGVDNLSVAVRIATTTANIYADATGQPDTTYYYWVRAVNIEGVIGPFNGVSGTPGTLAPLVAAEVPPQFIAHAMIGLLAVDDANVANLSAAKVTFGEMSGDRIAVNTLVGDRIMVNTLVGDRLLANSVTSDKVNGYNLVVYSGNFTGYAWPASGGGFFLGPQGLLLGNANTGQYFQVTADGRVFAPGLTIQGGNASFSGTIAAGVALTAPVITGGTVSGSTVNGGTVNGTEINGVVIKTSVLDATSVNAVDTVNIAGEAVVAPRSASALSTLSLIGTFTDEVLLTAPSITIPASAPASGVLVTVSVAVAPGDDRFPPYLSVKRGTTVMFSGVPTMRGMVTFSFMDAPGAGTWTYSLAASSNAATSADFSMRTIVVMGAKR